MNLSDPMVMIVLLTVAALLITARQTIVIYRLQYLVGMQQEIITKYNRHLQYEDRKHTQMADDLKLIRCQIADLYSLQTTNPAFQGMSVMPAPPEALAGFMPDTERQAS